MFEKIATIVPVASTLISEDDPPVFEVVNGDSMAKVLLTCDHAGAAIPAALENLGLGPEHLGRHISSDIGVAELGRAVAARLEAPLVLTNYSRLMIDVNRTLDDPTSVCVISDGAVVPGNRDLTPEEKERRAEIFFRPYHDAIDGLIVRSLNAGTVPAVVALHSFTRFFNGRERLCDIGLLWYRDPRLVKPLLARLKEVPDLTVGENQPYSGTNGHGYSMEYHADSRGLANVLIEVRQDHIHEPEGLERIAGILGEALSDVLADPSLYEARRSTRRSEGMA